MARPLRAIIDVTSMRTNLGFLRQQLKPQRVWAVVKANAYGHSMKAALLGFEQADGLALIEPEFALWLREQGWSKPILLMEGVFDEADVANCAKARIDFVVHDKWQLELIESSRSCADLKNAGTRLWIKFNSGMNRLGFAADEGLRQLERLHRAGFSMVLLPTLPTQMQLSKIVGANTQYFGFCGSPRQSISIFRAAFRTPQPHIDCCKLRTSTGTAPGPTCRQHLLLTGSALVLPYTGPRPLRRSTPERLVSRL